MSRLGNIRGRFSWCWGSILAGALLAVGVPVHGDDALPAAPRMDWSHARRAFGQLETWVRSGSVQIADPPEPIPVADLAAVRVTIRQFGRTLGIGDAVMLDAGVNDLLDATADAARRAIPDAAGDLNELYRRDQRLRDPDKPLAIPQWTDISALFTADLQLAYLPQRINLPTDAPQSAIYHLFAPGYHGLRLHPPPQHAATPPRWIWPATALAQNMSPPNQLNHLLVKLGYHLDRDLPRLAKPDGPVIERFEVIHLTRPAMNQPVVQLTRGNVLVERNAIGEATLSDIAARLADHLIRRQREDHAFSGVFNPSANTFKTNRADPGAAALAALALMRFASHHGDIERSDRAQRTAQKAIDLLLGQLLDEQQPAQPLAMALTVLTIIESPRLAGYRKQRDALAQRLAAMADEQGTFRQNNDPAAAALDPTQHAIVVAALAALYQQTRDADLRAQLQRSLAASWQLLAKRPAVGPLPWLIDAQFTMDRLGKPADEHGARVAQMRDLINQCLTRQIVRRPALGPPDVLGGFQFARKLTAGSAPQPDWRSAYGLALIAAALRHPQLGNDRDRLRHLVNGQLAARFIAQLMYERSNSYYVANPPLVNAAVRAALHDNTLSITATAASLLAVTAFHEAVESVD